MENDHLVNQFFQLRPYQEVQFILSYTDEFIFQQLLRNVLQRIDDKSIFKGGIRFRDLNSFTVMICQKLVGLCNTYSISSKTDVILFIFNADINSYNWLDMILLTELIKIIDPGHRIDVCQGQCSDIQIHSLPYQILNGNGAVTKAVIRMAIEKHSRWYILIYFKNPDALPTLEVPNLFLILSMV